MTQLWPTCMPADVFRMLICGPSNSGKTNTLLHMLYELLEFDKVFLFSKTLHQNKYQALLRDFAENFNPDVGYEVFDDLVCERNQNSIINYFINGRHRNCSVVYLSQTFYKVPKNIRDNCSHFCIFQFLPHENKRIAAEIGVDHDLLDHATDKKFSFLYYEKPRKSVKKNFDEYI